MVIHGTYMTLFSFFKVSVLKNNHINRICILASTEAPKVLKKQSKLEQMR